MRRVLVLILATALFSQAMAAPLPTATAPWPESGLRWIKGYRTKKTPMLVPGLIRELSQHGNIRDPDTSGVYVGFLAGVLASNPSKAWQIIDKILPLPFEDQWVVIRAVAYSGIPQWQDTMRVLALHLPDRQVMVDQYLSGKLPALEQVALEQKKPGTMDKVKSFFKGDMLFKKEEPIKRQVTFATHPELIDVLWGIYYATGDEWPIARILLLLPWSKERDNVDKLTIGSMAKFTLASNAARDVELLAVLKRLADSQSKEIKPVLADVIEAAETADTGHIGKEALAAVDELKRKGPGSTRDLTTWGAAGEALLSLGCLGLAAAGQIEAGIPCVVGGALTSGALRYLGRTD
jgi:hypothetical protein